jgi:hypothetical protein
MGYIVNWNDFFEKYHATELSTHERSGWATVMGRY